MNCSIREKILISLLEGIINTHNDIARAANSKDKNAMSNALIKQQENIISASQTISALNHGEEPIDNNN